MAFRSAAVVIREFDFSQFAPALGLATFAVLGGATKGPMNTPTLFSSVAELVDAHGAPVLNDNSLQAAITFLAKGANLVFSRIGHGQATADIPIPGLSGGTPAVKATGTIAFNASTNPADGDSVTIHTTLPKLRVDNDAVGAAGNVTITKVGANIAVSGMAGGTSTVVATGTIQLTAQPADGNTIVLGDGTNSKTFEFDSNATITGGNVMVTIGADIYATMDALRVAINAQSPLAVTASDLTVKKTFEFDSNASFTGGSVGVTIGTTAAATLLNLLTAIAGQVATLGMTVADTTSTVPQLTLTSGTGGAAYNAVILKSGTNVLVTGFTGGSDGAAGSNVTVAAVEAASPGTWGNVIQVEIRATTTLGAPSGNFDMLVYAPVDESGSLETVERFNNMSLTAADPRFMETVLSEGISGETSPSAYVRADVMVAGSPSVGTYSLGTGSGVVGADGIDGLVYTDYIGTVTGQLATGLKALANPEATQYNILAVPGIYHSAVIAEAIATVTGRGDAIFIADPPFGLTRDQVIDWHNGVSNIVANALTQPLNSSYVATYWPWVRVYDQYNKKNVWLPPSGFVAAVYAYTDKVAGPWFAPAGHSRGPIDGDELEYSPDQTERDMLNAGTNRINPIVKFPDGLKLYGNRTTQRRATALDSIHVRRMLIYAEALCANAVKFLVFDPNDPLTWRRFELLVTPIMENIKANRGLDDFFVQSNIDTNPAAQRQQKVMRGKVGIRPIDAAEIIYVDFALFATGAEFNTNF